MKIGLVSTSVPAKLITDMATGDHWANRNGEICRFAHIRTEITRKKSTTHLVNYISIHGSCENFL